MDKQCNVCGEIKPVTEFYAMIGMRDGFRNDCKACNLAAKARRYAANPEAAKERVRTWQRDNPERLQQYRKAYRSRPEVKARDRSAHLRRTFGITQDEYETRLAGQGGGCAVCRRAPKPGKSLHVDHDHRSGDVRGLLCFSCNAALGHLADDAERIRALLTYLDR